MSFAPRIAPPGPPGPMYGTELDRAIERFSAAAVRARSLDPITTELVRLRCARYHDCRLCGSLRTVDAIERGLDETLADKVDRYETSDLGDRWKAALRLTDAMIGDPRSLDDPLVTELHEHFTDEQLIELTFDVMKWSFQKVLVALRLETADGPGLRTLDFDAAGAPHLGDRLTPA